MSEEINRIVTLEENIKGDLSKCQICKVNFTAIQPCIIYGLIIDKKKEFVKILWIRY